MRKELKTFEYTCDGCGKAAILMQEKDELPNGWETKFDYDMKFDYCKRCYKKEMGH